MKRLTVALCIFLMMIGHAYASPTNYGLLIGPHRPGDASYDEFWNDTVLMYDALMGTGCYSADRIYVAYGSGSDGSSSNPRYQATITDYAATNGGIDAAFSALDSVIGSDDHLFVWTFNHGGTWWSGEPREAQSGDSYLATQDGSYRDDDFAAKMAGLGYGSSVVLMQQCYSGGFINELELIPNTLTMTACRGNESAYRDSWTDPVYGNHHGEFNLGVYTGVTSELPDGTATTSADTNFDGFITMDEIFASVNSWVGLSDPQLSDAYNMASTYTVCGPIPAPGAILLGGIGVGLVGWLRRRRTL